MKILTWSDFPPYGRGTVGIVQVFPNSRNVIPGMHRCRQKRHRQARLTNMDVISGAGHDAIYAARVAPAGMIFVPCKDGISHNECEDAKSEHLEAGCNVLLHAMLEMARVRD